MELIVLSKDIFPFIKKVVYDSRIFISLIIDDNNFKMEYFYWKIMFNKILLVRCICHFFFPFANVDLSPLVFSASRSCKVGKLSNALSSKFQNIFKISCYFLFIPALILLSKKMHA